MNRNMIQYGVWPNCTNNCDFCLRLNRKPCTKDEQAFWLRAITENIKHVNWETDFPFGVSLLGGELFYIKDKKLQGLFLDLIQTIIDYVLTSKTPKARFSTVTNGLYEPSFLYRVVDLIKDQVGIERVDVNFSFDLKYRYKTEKAKNLALTNILAFRDRYNYKVGVQMILTQYLIDRWKKGEFDVASFIQSTIPGCSLAFLYPHPIHTGKKLDDFQFKRSDFLAFVSYLKANHYETYLNFINSTKNSGTFKYTGLRDKAVKDWQRIKVEKPVLSDGKEIIAECGHSTLYRCYADSNKCVLCDLQLMDDCL